MRRAGRHGNFILTDVSDAEAVESAASQIEEQLGPIDIWINDAMASVFSPGLPLPESL